MGRKSTIRRRNTGRLVAGGRTRRRGGGEHVISRVQIPVADRYVSICGAAVNWIKSDVVAHAEIQREPIGDLPLILEVKAINPAPVFGFKLVAVSVRGRDSEQERSETRAADAFHRGVSGLRCRKT